MTTTTHSIAFIPAVDDGSLWDQITDVTTEVTDLAVDLAMARDLGLPTARLAAELDYAEYCLRTLLVEHQLRNS